MAAIAGTLAMGAAAGLLATAEDATAWCVMAAAEEGLTLIEFVGAAAGASAATGAVCVA